MKTIQEKYNNEMVSFQENAENVLFVKNEEHFKKN